MSIAGQGCAKARYPPVRYATSARGFGCSICGVRTLRRSCLSPHNPVDHKIMPLVCAFCAPEHSVDCLAVCKVPPSWEIKTEKCIEMLAGQALKNVDVFHDSLHPRSDSLIGSAIRSVMPGPPALKLRRDNLRQGEGWWRRRESNPRPKSLSARRGSMLSPVPDGFAPCAQNGQDAHEASPMISRLQHGPSRNRQPTE